MDSFKNRLNRRLFISNQRWRNNRSIYRLTHQVNASSPLNKLGKLASGIDAIQPVVFFNASTRLTGISLNAAFSLLASLGMQMSGVPVVRFGCKKGMSLCVLGTDRTNPSKPPPCRACIAQSSSLYSDALVIPFTYRSDACLTTEVNNLSTLQLQMFEIPPPEASGHISSMPTPARLPLGQLVLPSIRWVLRRHHLIDDASTRLIYRQYILSANSVAHEFSALLDRVNPQAVILFNGQFFPEAVARWVCLQRGIRVITHEVGLQPFSAFFTTGEATAYPLNIPHDFTLKDAQNKRLDDYLSQRFQGQFSMAGIRFWSSMNGLDEAFLHRVAEYKQVVPIFTNVVFDTSQPHSNVLFSDMFSWLDHLLEIVRQHPETLFVLRAHPDEARPGKASQESVSQWVARNHLDAIPNIIFVEPNQPLSSYDLIQRSKFVLVYNSTIGLEASILGIPVLSAGRARYTQLPIVFLPSTPQEYLQQLVAFLNAQEIPIPPEFKINARRFLYYQLFRSSLPFSDYLEEDGIWPGFVRLKKFHPQSLTPDTSPAMRTIYRGICEEGDFMLESGTNEI